MPSRRLRYGKVVQGERRKNKFICFCAEQQYWLKQQKPHIFVLGAKLRQLEFVRYPH